MVFSDGLTFRFGFDMTGAFFAALSAVMFVLCAVFALSYTEHDTHRGRFFALLSLTLVTLIGLGAAQNLLSFYLCFELLSLVSFPLVLHTGTPAARAASMKYLGFSVFGASMALFGMLLLGGAVMAPFAEGGLSLPRDNTATWAYLLIAAGFCCKAGLMPLSNWLPTAHPEAPAPASALLSGVITKAGVLGLIRATYFVFGAEAVRGTFAQTTLLILAMATIFTGSMLAYKEQGLKKRLAFSSVSQLSYVVLGVMLLNPAGLSGALLQVLFHSCAKVGLFLCAGAIMHQAGLTRVGELTGLGKRMPVTMLCFGAFSLSLVGIPPLGGFFAKWRLAGGALALGGGMGVIATVVLLVSALLTAGYLFPIVGNAFFAPADKPGSCEADARMTVPMGLLAAFALLFGAFPQPFVRLFDAIAAMLIGGAL